MRVLVAEDDSISARLLSTFLTHGGFTVEYVDNGCDAWELVKGDLSPAIVLLDWNLPGLSGLEVCQRIRALRRATYVYVAIVSARCRIADMSTALAAGADEFICKPFRADEVLQRVRVAQRLLGGASGRLGDVLLESLQGPGGDVFVRHRDVVGRIMIHHGQVAWAHVSSEPGSLHALLAEDPSISAAEIEAVLDECAAARRHFIDVIVDWGLMERAALRERIRGWVAGKITAMSQWPAAPAFFAPVRRAGRVDTLFDVDEVCPAGLLDAAPDQSGEWSEVPEPSAIEVLATVGAQRTIDAKLDAALSIDGAFTAAIFDVQTGVCLGERGEPLDRDEVWPYLKPAMRSCAGHRVEEMFITTAARRYLVAIVGGDAARLIVVGTHRDRVALGLARLSLAEIARAG